MENHRSAIVSNLQALRLVAAALVVVSHLFDEAIDHGFMTQTFDFAGGFGVDLFFVISGFVMMQSAGDSFGKPGASGKFLVRRLQRIVPIYWIFTTLTLLVMVFAGSTMNKSHVDFWHVVSSYLFIPYARMEDGGVQPILGLGWTLNYEMFFYALFALALFLPRRVGLPALLGTLVLLSILYSYVPKSQVQLAFWMRPIILEFAGGMVLALLYRANVRLPWLIAGAIIAVSAWLLPVHPAGGRWLYWGPFAFTIAGAVALAAPPNYVNRIGRAILLGGDASYALYLSHPFTINIVAIVVKKLGLGLPAYLVLGIGGSIVASVIVHLWIENGIRDFFRSRSGRVKTKAEALPIAE